MVSLSKANVLPRQVAALALLLIMGGGCGSGAGAAKPSDQLARSSLEAALNSWRQGEKPGTVAGIEPAVQVVDTPWLRGQRLTAYEIVREEPSEMDKRFTVRLTLDGASGSQDVQYIVVGKGPVWVYRDEDYTRNMNMDNNPDESKTKSRKR
jgi:hypothetical protein